MRISRVAVENFRCLKQVDIRLEPLTALIGPNGSGKSAFINALRFFFGDLDVDDGDCWAHDRDLVIQVALTLDLSGLGADQLEPLNALTEEDGSLWVARRSEPSEEGRRRSSFVNRRRQVPEFKEIRDADNATLAKERYSSLKATSEFEDLPAWRNQTDALIALGEWESSHEDKTQMLEDASIGFNAGSFDLAPLIEVVFVPAVRDATVDAGDSTASNLRSLVERVVRPSDLLATEFEALDSTVRQRYSEILSDRGDQPLAEAEQSLSTRVSRFAPGAGVKLAWEERTPQVQVPGVRAELVEGGFATEIGRQGHGLQRAYVLALLGELAEQGATDSQSRPLLFTMIEEPELYQHPSRARSLARVLLGLTESEPIRSQIIYATHSPLMVGLDRIDGLRLFRLAIASGNPETSVSQVDLASTATELWEASGGTGTPFTAETLRPRLRLIAEAPVAEGFFAEGVVLVEGEEDKALVLAAARSRGWEPDDQGVAIIAVSGKTNLDRPLLVLRGLGIPTFVVFDGDEHKRNGPSGDTRATNRLLLRLLRATEVDYPATQITEEWAVFEETFAHTLRDEIGVVIWDTAMQEASAELAYIGDRSKNPLVIQRALARLEDIGKVPATLETLLDAIEERFAVQHNGRSE